MKFIGSRKGKFIDLLHADIGQGHIYASAWPPRLDCTESQSSIKTWWSDQWWFQFNQWWYDDDHDDDDVGGIKNWKMMIDGIKYIYMDEAVFFCQMFFFSSRHTPISQTEFTCFVCQLIYYNYERKGQGESKSIIFSLGEGRKNFDLMKFLEKWTLLDTL